MNQKAFYGALAALAVAGLVVFLLLPDQQKGHAPPPVEPSPAPTAIAPAAVAPQKPPAATTVPQTPTPLLQPALFGGVLDQHTAIPPKEQDSLHCDEAQIFRVEKGGRLAGVVLGIFGSGTPQTVDVEIRPTRDRWPTEHNDLTLARAHVTVNPTWKENGTIAQPDFLEKARVPVQFEPPLPVHAGDRLALVIRQPNGRNPSLSLATCTNDGYPLPRLARQQTNWGAPATFNRKFVFATYVIPDGTTAAPEAPPRPPEPQRHKGDPPPPLPKIEPIAWTNSAWQLLPPDVVDVTVGPDDRLWVSHRAHERPAAADEQKRAETEFNQKEPHLVEWRPVLFEPSGRIWFTHIDSSWDRCDTLYGYDGKTWIQHSLPDPQVFYGVPTGHGRSSYDGFNYFLDGRCFFTSSGTVHCFDGKEWSTHQFWAPEESVQAPLLVPEPQGGGFVVATPWNSERVWRWRAGKWTPIAMPPSVGDKPVYSIVPIDANSAWVDTGGGCVVHITYANAAKPATDLIALMRAAPQDPAAVKKLTSIGPSLFRLFRNPPRSARSPQHDAVYNAINTSWGKKNRDIPQTYGPYAVDRVDPLMAAAPGIALLSVVGLKGPGSEKGSGVLILGPNTKLTFIPGLQNMGLGSQPFSSGNLPVGKNRAWVTGGSTEGTHPSLLDLNTGKVLDVLPVRENFLYGLNSRGTLFAGERPDAHKTIGAYKYTAPNAAPVAADTSKSAVHELVPNPSSSALDTEGNLWSYAPKTGMQFFDGQRWNIISGTLVSETTHETVNFAGDGAAITAHFNSSGSVQASLVAGKFVVRAPTLHALIEENTALIAKAFGPASYNLQATRRFDAPAILADRDGNIWIAGLGYKPPSVYSKGKWFDAPDPRQFIWGVGDGAKILLGFRLNYANLNIQFFWATVDGAVKLEPVPLGLNHNGLDHLQFDLNHNLWISLDQGSGPPDSYTGLSRLLSPSRVVDEIPNGHVLLVDQSGNTWTHVPHDLGPSTTAIWRDGKIQSTVELTGENSSGLFSDRPGSVFLLTHSALLHFTEDPAAPGHYASDASYPCPELGPDACYSKRGFLISRRAIYSLPNP